MDRSAVSVVIPVRDGRRFIEEALASVVRQGPRVLDIIVIDDGSTDGTGDVVASLGDPRIVFLPNPGRGVSSARNFGVEQARAPWILFLDADDRLADGAVDLLWTGVDAAPPGTVVVYGDYDRIDAAGRRTGLRHLMRGRRKPSGQVVDAIAGGNFIVIGCAILQRAVFRRLGGFDPSIRLCEDWHLWCLLALEGPFHYLPDTRIVDYRMHDSSTMHRRARPFAEFEPAIERVFSEPAFVEALGRQKARERRIAAQDSMRIYALTEAARLRDWPAARAELRASARRGPSTLARTLVRLGASIAGF